MVVPHPKKEWNGVKLADVCELNMGQSPESKTYNDNGIGLPFFQGKTDFGSKHPVARIYCSGPKKIAKAGDILMSVRAPVGPVNIANTASCIGRGIAGLRAKNEFLDQAFLYFNLILNEKNFAALGTGSTFQAINKSQLADFELVLPPLEEQRAIARILVTSQEAIAEQEILIAKLRELKRSMMQHLFTHGTRGEKTKMTEIGKMPESWVAVELGDVCVETIGGGTPSTKNESFWSGKISWITSKWLGEDLYLHDGEKFISEEAIHKSATHIVPAQSLIFATRVGVGKVAINAIDLAINQDLAGLVISTDSCNEFLAYQLRSDRVQKHVRSLKRGATIQGITREDLKKILIANPEVNEQRKIASVLQSIDQRIQALQEKLSVYQNLFKSLLHELMSGERRIIT